MWISAPQVPYTFALMSSTNDLDVAFSKLNSYRSSWAADNLAGFSNMTKAPFVKQRNAEVTFRHFVLSCSLSLFAIRNVLPTEGVVNKMTIPMMVTLVKANQAP